MPIEEKGLIIKRYVLDGCNFKKDGDKYKLVATYGNRIFEQYLNKSYEEYVWDLILNSSVLNGERDRNFVDNLIKELKKGKPIINKAEFEIILKKDEIILFNPVGIDIEVSEPRSVRITNSSYSGGSIKFGKGRISSGGGTSISKSHDEITSVDTGRFVLTNKRLIYIGEKKTVDTDLSKITSVGSYEDGVIIHRNNKQKPEYFIGFSKYSDKYTFNNKVYYFNLTSGMVKAAIQGAVNLVNNN